MILVDVQVPALDKTFDFVLNEELTVGELTEEIVQFITEHVKCVKEPEKAVLLYAFYKECILDAALTLAEQGIKAGEKLILL